MKQARPYRHRAIKTVSDHDAYLALFQLPDGELFAIATLNLSIKAAHKRPVRLQADIVRIARQCDVLVIQEAGAARDVIDAAVKILNRSRTRNLSYKRWEVWYGDGRPGQASTPIIWRVDRADAYRVHAHPLTGHVPLAPAGAGPAVAKPKWLMTLSLLMGEAGWVNVGNIHATPSTRYRLNAIAALRQFRRSARYLEKIPGLSFAAGDLNQNAATLSRFLRPWRQHGLRSTQRALGPIDTGPHGTPIDDVHWEHERQH